MSDQIQALLTEHRALAKAAHARDDIPEANYQYGWVAALTVVSCPHDSLSGDEGPVAELGRMPVRWRCDACGTIVHQCASQCGAVNGCRCLLSDAHTGDHQCAHGYWLNRNPDSLAREGEPKPIVSPANKELGR